MGRILNAEDVLLHLKSNKSEIETMVANEEFDYIRVSLDNLLKALSNHGSEKYDNDALNNLGDFLLLLPYDLAFSILKDLTLIRDVCERMLLERNDVFEILRQMRKSEPSREFLRRTLCPDSTTCVGCPNAKLCGIKRGNENIPR